MTPNPTPSTEPDTRPGRVLLTGATGGLGPPIARSLARAGYRLGLSALPGPELDRLAAELEAPALPLDLRDPDGPARLVDATKRALDGAPDALVHNAGMEAVGRFELQPPDVLEAVLRVNLMAAMGLSRRLLPDMLAHGRGRLVFMASMAGRTAPPFTSSYAASKAGLVALARSLRQEYRGRGVSATVVIPGFVRGAGMFERGRLQAGFRPSPVLATVGTEAVARAVLRALESDEPEILVQRGPVRVVLALADLFPGLLGERMNRWVGANRIFREWAEYRAAAGSGSDPAAPPSGDTP